MVGIGADSMSNSELASQTAAGSRRALARLLTLIQDGESEAIESVSNVENVKSIGITGPPGVGKSCLTDCLASFWAGKGERVGVLCIDPSSPLTGGSLLGDRMRMEQSGVDDRIFIRSVATRSSFGSLPLRLRAMISALSLAGMDRILIETVGVGQTEIGIVSMTDSVLLVDGPDRGDIVQAEKAGLLELADVIVVNKGDLDGAEQAAANIRSGLALGNAESVPVLVVSALNKVGIDELVHALENAQARSSVEEIRWRHRLTSALLDQVLSDSKFDSTVIDLAEGRISLEQALQIILKE
ncbi:MAG: hypothetical protein QF500_01150 [Candidatus Thalassarchaeaceae archaeon]|jgi:LAO/AO transport system kinase|nr:hypothetical protein [Candidatus Thalassarchaeaceae archaeon]